MDLNEEIQKRNEFQSLLLELAKESDALDTVAKREKIYKKVESIYKPNSKNETFRHFYSDIFSTLSRIKNEENLGDIQTLGQNITILRAIYKVERVQSNQSDKNHNFIVFVDSQLRKIYDHLSLDIARMDYSDSKDRETSRQANIQDLEAQINNLENELEKANSESKTARKEVGKLTRELQKSQKEYVAILGIFAAVVVTFMGGLSFTSAAIESINNENLYRAILICLVVGLVLVNALYGLFHYIDRVVNCKDTEKNEDYHQTVKPLKMANITFAVLIFGVGFFYILTLIHKV